MRESSSIRRPTRNAAASVLYVRKTRRGVSSRHGGRGPATAEAGTVCAILCSGDVEGNTASSPGPPPAATSQVHGSPRMAPLITPRPAPPGEPEATARGARNEDAPAASRALPLPAVSWSSWLRPLTAPGGRELEAKGDVPPPSRLPEVGGIWCDSRRRTRRGLSAPRQTGRPGREATVQAHGPPASPAA